MTWGHRLIALVLALAAPATAQAQDLTREEQRAAEVLMRTEELLEAGRNEEAERNARLIIESRPFQSFRPEIQVAALQIYGAMLTEQLPARCSDILPVADRLLATQPQDAETNNYSHYLAFWSAYVCDDDERAARTIASTVQRTPSLLAELPDYAVVAMALNLNDAATLSHFVNGSWRPSDPATDLSLIRLRLTRLHLRAGNLDQAREAAQDLIDGGDASARAIVVLLVDKEFDPITRTDPTTYNYDRILERQLSNLEARAIAAPDSLSLQIQRAEALYVRNRLPEALAVADAALARIANSTEQSPAFSDQADQLNWLHDQRGTIINAMGSPEEGLAALQQGIEAGEDGKSDNVSQLLNRSAELVRHGRPTEALEHVDRLNLPLTSPYGRMVALRVQACAFSQLGNEQRMRGVLDQLSARAEDSHVQVEIAATCANDLDLAARMLIAQLQSEDHTSVLIRLQRFTGEEPRTDHERTMHQREGVLRARPDVIAAVERIARIETFSTRAP